MTRYIRNTVVTAKVEATAGTDALPTGLADAVLVSDMSITPLDAANIDRNNIQGYFGANEQLVGPASVKTSYTVELAGSGTAGAGSASTTASASASHAWAASMVHRCAV